MSVYPLMGLTMPKDDTTPGQTARKMARNATSCDVTLELAGPEFYTLFSVCIIVDLYQRIIN